MADIVAKVFLRGGSQILRGVGAAIEQRCGGPRRQAPNSQAILAAGLRLYRAAIVACFVLWREFSSCGFWDFCNTIGTFRTCRSGRSMSVPEGKAENICSHGAFLVLTHSGRKLSLPELPTAVGNFLMDFSPVKAQRFYNSIT
jgi:hypothetical protein